MSEAFSSRDSDQLAAQLSAAAAADTERWDSVYGDNAAIYEDFSRYEDAGDLVLARLFSHTSLAGQTVLEIGCGSGRYTRQVAQRCARLLALDVSAPLLEQARAKCAGIDSITFLQARAEALPLADASIDAVFSSWALDGIVPLASREQALSECERVLRPAGEIWVAGNHWSGAFMEMRGPRSVAIDRAGFAFMRDHGFEHVETIDTHFAFPSLDDARRILTFIFGQAATTYLNVYPSPFLEHKVVLLHKQKAFVAGSERPG